MVPPSPCDLMAIRRKDGSETIWRRTGSAPGEKQRAVAGRRGAGAVAKGPEDSDIGDAIILEQRRLRPTGGDAERRGHGHGETELACVFHNYLCCFPGVTTCFWFGWLL